MEDSSMSIALNYQLSIFGKYNILPNPETITDLMAKINQSNQIVFLPNLISSQQIEIPTNKITMIPNLGFITQNRQYSITILNERIDINYNRIDGTEIGIGDFYIFAENILSKIITYSDLISNRLAMNIQYVCDALDACMIMHTGKKLLKNVAYYDDKDLSEWSMRTNSQVDIKIEDLQEKLNVITNISSGQEISTDKPVILFHIDINTLPQNQAMRFSSDSLRYFVKESQPIAEELIDDVERLISE